MVRRRLLVSRPAKSKKDKQRSSSGPLVVAGLFRTSSGIGRSARSCAEALDKFGIDYLRCDLSATFNQVDLEFLDASFELPESRWGTLILHLNAPETLAALRALRYRNRKRWRVIGYWVWELDVLPSSWEKEARHLTEIWTPTEFSANAIRRAVDIPVVVVPHFVEPPARNLDQNPFREEFPLNATIIGVFADGRSSFDRKNLLGSIGAFLSAAGTDPNCWLLVKTRNLDEHPSFKRALCEMILGHGRVRLLDGSLSEVKKWEVINACDIVLSLHRSEGFGLVLAEAMSLRKAVVATDWSGNTEFMSQSNSCPVPYELVVVMDEYGVYSLSDSSLRWADADLGYAVEILKQLIDNTAMRQEIGERARLSVGEHLDGRAYIKALRSL